jgi:hypothetical protein
MACTAPDSKVGHVGLAPCPSFLGGHVRNEGVREVVVEDPCVLKGIAPEVVWSISCAKEAASHLHKQLVACLSNAVLFR